MFFGAVRDLGIVCRGRNGFSTEREGVRDTVASCAVSTESWRVR